MAAEYMGLTSQDQILFIWFHDYEGSNDYCPKFMILKDEISKSIVLTVRGTWEPKDVISMYSYFNKFSSNCTQNSFFFQYFTYSPF